MKNNKNRVNKIIVLLIMSFFVLAIRQASAFEISSATTQQSTCPGSTVLFTATLTGTGNFNINLDGKASSWTSAVPPGIHLEQGSETIYVYATPSSETQTGLYDLNLKVTSQEGTKIIQYTINVISCHGLEIAGEVKKDVCSCKQGEYQLSITNSGTFQEIYDIELKGPALEYITQGQKSIMLNPGETKPISLYADIPCGKEGIYEFTLSIGNKDVFRELKGTLNIGNCFGFKIKTEKDYVSFCEHTINTVPITIENTAEEDNRFDLKITGPAWASLEKKEMELGASQKGNINLIINPDYGVSGDFDIRITATEQKNKISQEKVIKANIKDCYSVNVDIIEDKATVCSEFTKEITVDIKNEGEISQEYKLNTNYDWAVPKIKTLNIRPGEKQTVVIELNPAKDTLTQNYDLTLHVSSTDDSKTTGSDAIKVQVLSKTDCYKPEINAEGLKVKKDSSATLPITIKNAGIENAEYTIIASGEGVGFFQINPAILSIESGKSKTTYLYIAPGINTQPGEYAITISVKVKEGDVLASKNLKMQIEEAKGKITGETIKETKGPGLFTRIKNWFSNLFRKEETNESEKETPPSTIKEKVLAYKYPLIIGIIVLIILVILIVKSTRKDEDDEFEEEFKDEDFSDDEFEEGEGEIKLGRWIIGIILLIIAFILIRKYWTGILFYKYYITLGVIILILMILAIKYWGKIIEFFEEEDKDEFEEEFKDNNKDKEESYDSEIIEKPQKEKDKSEIGKRKRGRPPKKK
ncbi:MAG: hypothetical protein KKG60_03205 [Nanoarchaeota archaeon]|nr:hypothetical protein [Nanoarchaeota archaeon]